MRVLGMLSGTSVDAIDTALVEFTRDAADPAHARAIIVRTDEQPWDEALREELLGALPPARSDAGTWCRLHALTGEAFARAARCALADDQADLVVSHGQTLHHWVDEDGIARGTLQIGDPARIAAATSLPVLADLRAADIARGGQGAPLVPLLDALALGSEPTAALNIGGIANVSIIGAGQVRAGDTGPGNGLLDAAVHERSAGAAHIDRDGALARAGRVHPEALAALLADPFYARPFPRSTGREHFCPAYAARTLQRADLDITGIPLADLAATLTELTAQTIASGIEQLQAGDARGGAITRVVGSGGGMRNPVLRARLAELLDPIPLLDSDAVGLPSDAKEAVLMALIGWLSVQGLPGTLARADGTAVTGAREPAVLGSLSGGMPPAAEGAPVPITRLTLSRLDPGGSRA